MNQREKNMKARKTLSLFLSFYTLFSFACVYIVLPEDLEQPESQETVAIGWAGIVTNVGKSDAGDLRIEITIRNDTGDWSAMKVVDGKPAVLTSDGKSSNCETIFFGTGGHRLAPGFQMRGYTAGTKAEPATQ